METYLYECFKILLGNFLRRARRTIRRLKRRKYKVRQSKNYGMQATVIPPAPVVEAYKRLHDARQCFKVLILCWDKSLIRVQEHFGVLFLDHNKHAIGFKIINMGSSDSCPVDIRLIFAMALNSGAALIVLAHNHPSCELQPSTEDKRLTKRIVDTAKTMNIIVMDHLIISDTGYYSFRERGLIK